MNAVHGQILVSFVQRIDECIAQSVDTGRVPVLDAVETSRLLKALIVAQKSYDPDVAAGEARAIRGRDDAGFTVMVLSFGWSDRSAT